MGNGKKYDKLFQQYIDVCNKALEKNKDVFPYKQILSATESLINDKKISMDVFDDRPKARFNIQMNKSRFELTEPEESDDTHAWHLNASYLEEVVNNPDKYINNPAKIDWDWLKSRVGM